MGKNPDAGTTSVTQVQLHRAVTQDSIATDAILDSAIFETIVFLEERLTIIDQNAVSMRLHRTVRFRRVCDLVSIMNYMTANFILYYT